MSDPTPIGRVLADLKLPAQWCTLCGVDVAAPSTAHLQGCEYAVGPPARGRLDPGDPQSDDEGDRRLAVAAAVEACMERFPARYRYASIGDLRIDDIEPWAEEFRADPTKARSLLLLGGTGSGKTHAAYAALRHAVTAATKSRAHVYRTPRWKALTHADLMASLRPRAAKDQDAESVLLSYQETDLLFIDDLGAIKATEFVEEMTYRLINGRYEAMRPCIVTSNLPLAELKDAIGDRIASRLAQDSVRIALTTPDRRRQRAA